MTATMERTPSGLLIPEGFQKGGLGSITPREMREIFGEEGYQRLKRQRGFERMLPRISGGSFVNGTSTEILYDSIATGTQLNTFTTEDSLMKTLPLCVIPANFIGPSNGGVGKSLRLRVLGRVGAVTPPTWLWTVRLLTSATWSAAGLSVATAAVTGVNGTLVPWFLDLDIICRSIGTSANTTLAMMGQVQSPLGLASPFSVSIPASNTAFTVTTYDATLTNYLFVSVTCGTSNAANLMQIEMIKLYGEN